MFFSLASRLHLVVLAFLLFSASVSSGSAQDLLQGTDFQYRTEGMNLVEWKDKDFPDGLFGLKVKIKGEGIPVERDHIEGIHVGAYSFTYPGEPNWLEDIEFETEWTPSEKAHCMDLVITGRNKTKRRIALREHPLAIWVGPVGTSEGGRYSIQELRGFDGRYLATLAPGTPIEPATKWISITDRYRATVLELLDGPGRFLVEKLPAEETGPDGKPAAFQGHLLTFKLFDEIQSEEEFRVRLRVFTGLKREAALRDAGYLALFDTWGGWFGWIAYLVFLLLKFFYGLTANWGLSIVLMTIVVKLALHPLSRKQLESMAKMQELQPRIQGLQVRYKDNPQRMQAEVTKLWAEAGVNPLSGCLPLFMQMPIFIALYNCLSYATELRGVEFLWLTDLSKADPYLILPVLFALGIYISSSQTATDPSQKTMMQIMPVMMFFFMQGIPSGVMIYLAGQTILGIFEQRANADLRERMKQASEAAKAEGTEEDGEPGEDRVIDNDTAAEVREEAAKNAGNKYKQARKNRKS
jgi:YidC/Oxa1 family membrane protein insertase